MKVIANATVKPPSLSGTITFAGKLPAAAQVAIVPPSVSIVASLEAKLVLLRARLELASCSRNCSCRAAFVSTSTRARRPKFGPELVLDASRPTTLAVSRRAGTFAVVLLAEGAARAS